MQQYISTPKKTTKILADHGIKLRKSLGQNYIIDTNIIKKMVLAADIKKGEDLLEIGSGIGSLTEILLENNAGRIICIEIDKKAAEAFKDVFPQELKSRRLELITKDALDIDYNSLSYDYHIEKMVSNLPYKIAAPLVLKILREAPGIKRSWVTIQKDMAERIMAVRGDRNYSSYTVKANFLAEYKLCFKISRNCFMPKPFVDSVVLEISKKKLPGGFKSDDVENFFRLVNSSFLHRRKKLLNSLALNQYYRSKLDKINALLKDIGKDPDVRPEHLSLEEYIFIFKNLQA